MKIKEHISPNQTVKFYISVDYKIRIILLSYEHTKHQLFISSNGDMYQAIEIGGSSQDGLNKSYSFLLNDIAYKFDITKDKISLTSKNNNHELNESPMYDELNQEYIFKNELIIESVFLLKNTLIYVIRPEFMWNYSDFKLVFYDTLDNPNHYFNIIKCDDVTRYRDGGTTYYETQVGTLFKPTSFNNDKKPYWKTLTDTHNIKVMKISEKYFKEDFYSNVVSYVL